MDNFKNFGEALAWMMESPENVAVSGIDCRYRWNGRLEFLAGCWTESAGNWDMLARHDWSRAPREPLEFRWDAVKCRTAWGSLTINQLEFAAATAEALRPFPEGTEFELILKEKN